MIIERKGEKLVWLEIYKQPPGAVVKLLDDPEADCLYLVTNGMESQSSTIRCERSFFEEDAANDILCVNLETGKTEAVDGDTLSFVIEAKVVVE